MTDTTIRCRCGYTVNGHCSRCDGPSDGIRLQASPFSDMVDDSIDVLNEVAMPSIVISIVLAFLVILFTGCGVDNYDAGPATDACDDAGEPTEDAGEFDPCAERQALWCDQGCEGTPLFVRECAATAPHCECGQ